MEVVDCSRDKSIGRCMHALQMTVLFDKPFSETLYIKYVQEAY